MDKYIERMIREIVENLAESGVDLHANLHVKRVERLLQQSLETGVIVDFMSMGDYKKFGNFLVRVIKGGRYQFFSVMARVDTKDVKRIKRGNIELKERLKRKYIPRLPIAAGSDISDISLVLEWQKILNSFKRS